jgi:hypothetical protein
MAISLFSSSLPLIKDWRTPAAIVGCGCLIALINLPIVEKPLPRLSAAPA